MKRSGRELQSGKKKVKKRGFFNERENFSEVEELERPR